MLAMEDLVSECLRERALRQWGRLVRKILSIAHRRFMFAHGGRLLQRWTALPKLK